MIVNTEITVFHKTLNQTTRLYEWTRYNYTDCWWFGSRGSSIQKGYENSNDVSVRIPFSSNENVNIANFSIGDIICKGRIEADITTQADVPDAYNILFINNNNFGTEPHIHIGGK